MYIVEGNIGTGKSTFLKLVSEHLPHISVIFEPRHHWQSDNGESLLSNFYQDPQRWAYTLETLTMMCRVREHLIEQQSPSPSRLMERSIYSGHYCFAQNDFDNGFMNPIEWSAYNQWFNFLIPNRCKPPLGFIYLKTDPEISYERIKKRNRGSETGISLDYLKQIDACHTNFLIKKEGILPELRTVPVLVLECDTDFETDTHIRSNHLNQLTAFLQKTQLLSQKLTQTSAHNPF